MLSQDEQTGIYLGSRGSDFRDLISNILKRGKLKDKYINILTDATAMKIYGSAFTSELVDPDNNYQVLEQIGDLTGNKFIVSYMYQRFPQLVCTDGVKVVARLRINYGAKASFCEIARKLGFWPFISATNDLRQRKMKPLLEDVFEAFLGATEQILDNRKRVGVGYGIVYDILSSIFNDMEISLRYEDLYDAKTRLKELFDLHESSIGPLVYQENKKNMITYSTVYRVCGGKYEQKIDARGNTITNKKRIVGGKHIKIGIGSAALKSDAQQSAAADALVTLNKEGWCKPIPSIYRKFNNNEDNIDEKFDESTIYKTWGSDVNALQATKGKSKYQSKYQSTPIALYCRVRNLSGVTTCIKMGSDINIPDSDGMFPVDLLFIGKLDEKSVKKILKKLLKNGNLKMHRQVFETYFPGYVKKYFGTVIDQLVLVE